MYSLGYWLDRLSHSGKSAWKFSWTSSRCQSSQLKYLLFDIVLLSAAKLDYGGTLFFLVFILTTLFKYLFEFIFSTFNSLWGAYSPGEGFHMKGTRVPVALLRDENYGIWSHSGCKGENAKNSCRQDLAKGWKWRNNRSVNPKRDHPPELTPGHLTFFKMFDQIPHYDGQLHGQMPHQSGLSLWVSFLVELRSFCLRVRADSLTTSYLLVNT